MVCQVYNEPASQLKTDLAYHVGFKKSSEKEAQSCRREELGLWGSLLQPALLLLKAQEAAPLRLQAEFLVWQLVFQVSEETGLLLLL